MNLITKVGDFQRTRHKKLRRSDDLAYAGDSDNPLKMHEESYAIVVSAFAEMCGLHVE